MQEKLQQIAVSIRRRAYLLERMFPRFREQIGTAFDLIVEFSTLGEYRLAAEVPGASSAPADASGQAPQLGGTGSSLNLCAAVRRTVAGGPTGSTPVATPAARRLMKAAEARAPRTPAHKPPLGKPVVHCSGNRRRPTDAAPRRRARKGTPVVAEQLCLAV